MIRSFPVMLQNLQVKVTPAAVRVRSAEGVAEAGSDGVCPATRRPEECPPTSVCPR